MMWRARAWTDEQLRAAVAMHVTYAGVLRELGLASGSLAHLKREIARLQLDTSHFDRHPKMQLCDDASLRELVRTSSNSSEVLRRLGLELCGAHFKKLNRRIDALGIDRSHFVRRHGTPVGSTRTRWTDDQLRAAVEASTSIAQVIRAVGLVPAGGNYVQIQKRIAALGLDTSHFLGSGWNTQLQYQPAPPRPLAELLVAGRSVGSHVLKKRLFRAGLKQPACELCGWAARAPDGRVPVELDHINGDRDDNRLENLRILCPNCHSLQPTHRGLNQRRRRST